MISLLMDNKDFLIFIVVIAIIFFLGLQVGIDFGKQNIQQQVVSGFKVNPVYQTNSIGEIKIIKFEMVK